MVFIQLFRGSVIGVQVFGYGVREGGLGGGDLGGVKRGDTWFVAVRAGVFGFAFEVRRGVAVVV